MKKKTLGILLSALMIGNVLAGCGGGNSADTPSSSDNGGDAAAAKVAYLTPSLDVPFWRYVRHGVEDELSKNGIECVTYDSKDDANTQMSNAQDAITKQVDAIVISPTDSASCASVLSLAQESDVPVVICDIGTDSGEYLSFISTDNEAGGKAIGAYIASQLEPGTEVAQITLNQARINGVLRKDYLSFISTDNEAGGKAIGAYIASQLEPGTEVAQITLNQARINGVLRKDGFDKGIAENNLVDVDFKQMEKVNRSEGETYAQDLITAHPNLGAIFCHSEDPAMGAASALEAAGRTDVLVAAFDCSPEIVEGIRNGSIAGTSAQQPVLMGRNAAQAIVDHLAGKEVEKEIMMDTMLVTKDNIDEVYDTLVEVALDDGETK